MTRRRVSYYAHHFGTGHLRHAQKVAASELFDLQVTSTGPRNGSLLTGALEYVALDPDVGSGEPEADSGIDAYLHYAPTGELIQQRFAQLNHAWRQFKPDVVMVDVSVEVALFARLSGYRVAFRRMPGHRNDKAHQLAYELADALFAYYPAELEDPKHLDSFGYKSHYLAVAEAQANTIASPLGQGGKRKVVVQTSLASAISLELVVRAANDSPDWNWEIVGSVESSPTALPPNVLLHGVVADPLPILRSADVIISSAGHNAVVAAASCHRPVLLVPEERPFAEQRAFAQTLQRNAGVEMLESWRATAQWQPLLARISQGDPEALGKALFVAPADFERKLLDLVQVCATGITEEAMI